MAQQSKGLPVNIPPQSPDMERALLGAILSDGDAVCRIEHLIVENAFYIPKHREVWKAIMSLYDRGDPIDLVSISEKMRANGRLNEVGGMPFLTDLAAEVPTSANIEFYAGVIHEKYMLRKMIDISTDVVSSAKDPSARAEDMFCKILDGFAKIVISSRAKPVMSSSEAVRQTIQHIEFIKGRKYTGGIQTGLERLDKLVVEFDPGELVFIAARPSIGKTVFAQEVAEHNAKIGIPGMFFSLEMPITQIIQRTLSRESGVPLSQLRSRFALSDHHQTKIKEAEKHVSFWPIIYDHNSYENARQIGNVIRQTMMRTPIKYVVIDQLGHIVPEHPMDPGEHRMHLNRVLKGLKDIATSLGITIFVLHQISRDVKDVKDYRPRIDDLKDTGKVEEIADGVILIHRPEYYNDPKIKKLIISGEEYKVAGHAEIIVAKRRQGATGSVAVGFIGSLTKFYNLDAPTDPSVSYKETAAEQKAPSTGSIPFDEDLPF